jgi:hypothetical protein
MFTGTVCRVWGRENRWYTGFIPGGGGVRRSHSAPVLVCGSKKVDINSKTDKREIEFSDVELGPTAPRYM